MTDALLNTLTDYGALGVFAAFLIWQFMGMQKRLDSLTEKFQEQLDKINADYDERIEKMRERYDAVIQGGRKDLADAQRDFAQIRESVQHGVTDHLMENARKLEAIQEKVDEVAAEVRARP